MLFLQRSRVTFSDKEEGGAMNTEGVQNVLQFRNADLLGITRLELSNSPGRISVEGVSTVVIENSIFQ